jgi:hypothetical protein
MHAARRAVERTVGDRLRCSSSTRSARLVFGGGGVGHGGRLWVRSLGRFCGLPETVVAAPRFRHCSGQGQGSTDNLRWKPHSLQHANGVSFTAGARPNLEVKEPFYVGVLPEVEEVEAIGEQMLQLDVVRRRRYLCVNTDCI